LQEHSKETLDKWQIVRVSEDFRVFALGLPVPKYRGHPLDPPLRSRFQARNIYHLTYSVRYFLKQPFATDLLCAEKYFLNFKMLQKVS